MADEKSEPVATTPKAMPVKQGVIMVVVALVMVVAVTALATVLGCAIWIVWLGMCLWCGLGGMKVELTEVVRAWTGGAFGIGLGFLLTHGSTELGTWALGRWFTARLGGYSGDCLGATQQLVAAAEHQVGAVANGVLKAGFGWQSKPGGVKEAAAAGVVNEDGVVQVGECGEVSKGDLFSKADDLEVAWMAAENGSQIGTDCAVVIRQPCSVRTTDFD